MLASVQRDISHRITAADMRATYLVITPPLHPRAPPGWCSQACLTSSPGLRGAPAARQSRSSSDRGTSRQSSPRSRLSTAGMRTRPRTDQRRGHAAADRLRLTLEPPPDAFLMIPRSFSTSALTFCSSLSSLDASTSRKRNLAVPGQRSTRATRTQHQCHPRIDVRHRIEELLRGVIALGGGARLEPYPRLTCAPGSAIVILADVNGAHARVRSPSGSART